MAITDIAQVKDSAHYALLNKIVDRYLQGETSATRLAKEFGIKRHEVDAYIAEWQKYARSRPDLRELATESITAYDRKMNAVVKELWDVKEQAASSRETATTLKMIADIEAKRQEILHKCGIFDDSAFTEQLMDMEEKVNIVQQILLDVVTKYPNTKSFIMTRLSEASMAPRAKNEQPEYYEEVVVAERVNV